MIKNSTESTSFSFERKEAIHKMIIRMFKYYDRSCFNIGLNEIIEDSKTTAKEYRDKLLNSEYELKAIEMSINNAVHYRPKKDKRKAVKYLVPELRTIMIGCDNASEYLKEKNV